MLDNLKLALAGWSFRRFAGKQIKRGIRLALGALAGWASGLGVEIPVEAQAVVGAVAWQIVEAGASAGKLAAERSDKFQWVAKLL